MDLLEKENTDEAKALIDEWFINENVFTHDHECQAPDKPLFQQGRTRTTTIIYPECVALNRPDRGDL